MCDILNKQYSSVFSTPSVNHKDIGNDFFNEETGSNDLRDIEITEDEVSEAIQDLKSNSAGGSDGIPAKALKKLKPSILIPLTKLIPLLLREGLFPDLLKHADIVPIHKGKSKCEAKNYRQSH